LQHELDTILLFLAAGTMNPNDLDEPVEYRSPLTSQCRIQFDLKRRTSWITLQHSAQMPSRLLMAETQPGHVMVQPTKNETFIRCSEATSEDIVECIEIAPPSRARHDARADVIKKPSNVANASPSIWSVSLGAAMDEQTSGILKGSNEDRTYPVPRGERSKIHHRTSASAARTSAATAARMRDGNIRESSPRISQELMRATRSKVVAAARIIRACALGSLTMPR
jgi:hypothetical protein